MYKKIIGIEAPTDEYIYTISETEYQLKKNELKFSDDKVEFLDNYERFELISASLSKAHTCVKASGGSISNTLYSFSFKNYGDNKMFEIELNGSYHSNNYINSNNSLDSLRKLGVSFNLKSNINKNRKGICIVDNKTRDVLKIIIFPNEYPIEIKAASLNFDYLFLTFQRLELIEDVLFETILNGKGEVVLFIADYSKLNVKLKSRIKSLLHLNRIRFLFGQKKELESLNLIRNDKPIELLSKTEIIATNGSDDVYIWDPKAKQKAFYKNRKIKPKDIVSTLGAGDTYSGAYVWERLNDSPISESHILANLAAIQVLYSISAKVDFNIDLNNFYGKIMQNRTGLLETEMQFYDTIRNNCGYVIISCGQTGVDQIGLKVANDLGLPSYSLMPKGKRTERTEKITNGSDTLYNSFILQYSSSSYRFTTYSTVFMSDGTLIFDYAKSEGSQATRDACILVGRPFLDLAKIDIQDLGFVNDWIIKNGIRVVNVAGNRERFLTKRQQQDCNKKLSIIFRLISVYNQNVGRLRPFNNNKIEIKQYNLTIAIGNSSESKSLIKDFMDEVFNIKKIFNPKKLLWDFEAVGIKFYFVKSRDIPYLIKNQYCNIGLCGTDIIIESKLRFDNEFNTGIQPCLIVEIAKKNLKEIKLTGSQYPVICNEYLKDKQVSTIHIKGSAEAWLVGNWCDTIVDTWRTGKTVYENDLVLHNQVFSTFLNLIYEIGEKEESFSLLFKKWLYGHLKSK